MPGEFFPSTADDEDLAIIRKNVSNFAPCTPTHKPKKETHIPTDLPTATHAFIRVDAHKKPLTRPYTGPFKIIDRRTNAYKLNVNGKADWIALD